MPTGFLFCLGLLSTALHAGQPTADVAAPVPAPGPIGPGTAALGGLAGSDWCTEGNQLQANLGYFVASAGDVNGDGYDDVIVGAPFYDNTLLNQGRAYVFHGSATGLSATADWMAEGNQALGSLGLSVSTAGDVNGDGYDDVIVGAPSQDNGQTDEGRAFVYLGSSAGLSTTANWSSESNQANSSFGAAVATAGDVNGDGYDDVIVAARRYDNGQTDEGRVYAYLGSPSGLATTPSFIAESNLPNPQYGVALKAAGDVNGDGYGDIIVGAPSYSGGQSEEGRLYVYFGSATGLSAVGGWTAESNSSGANLGVSVSGAGDVNDDGYDDVIGGAYFFSNGQSFEGRAYVYHGSATGLGTTAVWVVESDQMGASLGSAVSSAGDFNGDGYDDVIVGASGYSTSAGRTFIYAGSSTGLGTTAHWFAGSDQSGAFFGIAAACAGDVNGDGNDDVIIGAPYINNPEGDEGIAFVYHGIPTWKDLGGATAGSNGTPQLAGSGALGGGQAVTLTLSLAKPGTAITLVIGLSALGAPFKGGTLVPFPDTLISGLPTDGQGKLVLGSTWPAGLPSGFTFFTQCWIPDAAGPAGFAASNGLAGTTP